MAKALEYDTSVVPEGLISTRYYFYNCEGNVTRVVVEAAEPEAGEPKFSSTRLEYAKNGAAVTFVLGETWDPGATPEDCPVKYTVTYAREFRYDGARQRYLNRELDPVALQEPTPRYAAVSETWTDYDGDEPYGDFKVTVDGQTGEPTLTELRSFELGMAAVDPWASVGPLDTVYLHANHLGSTVGTSDAAGAATDWRVRTAFGEPVAGPADRYGYAGAWGYQSTLHETSGQAVFPFLHVGARYYDPSTGRFLQRDPIGIAGGLNVYDYVRSIPTFLIDPAGAIPSETMDAWPPEQKSPEYQAGRRRTIKKAITVASLCIANPWSKLKFGTKLVIWLYGWANVYFD